MYSHFSLAFPSLVVKMPLYLWYREGVSTWRFIFRFQGEQKKGRVRFLHQLFLKSLYFRAIDVLPWSVLG